MRLEEEEEAEGREERSWSVLMPHQHNNILSAV